MGQDERVRHVREGDAGLLGHDDQILHQVELPLVRVEGRVVPGGDRGAPLLIAADPRVLGGLLPAAVLPGEPPAGQRAPHDGAHPVSLDHRQDVPFDVPGEDAVGRLLADESLEAAPLAGPMGLHDHRGREGRTSEVTNLPLMHQVRQRPERLLKRRLRPGAMDLVQVDVVGAQPAEGVLDLPRDPQSGIALLVHSGTHLAVDLGGQDYLVPPSLQGLADDLFRRAFAIDVGRVDEVDPGVERSLDDANGVVDVRVAPGAEHHGSQAERADVHSCLAELSIFHGHRRKTGGFVMMCAAISAMT